MPSIPPELRAELAKLTKEERMHLADMELCRQGDLQWIIERHRKIKDKTGKVHPMGKLKLAQRKLLATIKWGRDKNIPVRVIVAKSRKQGISTAVAADAYEEVKNKQLDASVLAHDKKGVSEIFRIYQRFYAEDDLPKPNSYKGKVNQREMKFDDHDGHITVATANNIYAGTGETPQYLHLSEVAKWDRGVETKTALLQAIGDEPGTTLIEESTFNGEEGCFLPTWRASYDNCKLEFIEDKASPFGLKIKFEVTNPVEWNHYMPIFISVLDDESARLPFESDEEKARFEGTLDEDERIYRDMHGASLESLNWLRRTLKLKCQNNKDVRKQEYPVTETEAIRASGRPRFNLAVLDRMPIEEGTVGRLQYQSGNSWNKSVVFVQDPQGYLTIFRQPMAGHRYYIGCDTAEGSSLEEGATSDDGRNDSSVIIVYDLDSIHEQVATYESKEPSEEIADPLVMIGIYYNNAFLTIESNSTGKATCIMVGQKYDRSLLYHRDDWDVEKSRHQRAIGNKTTTDNRNTFISLIADALNQNRIILHDRRTVMQMKSFVYNRKGRAEAAFGKHDDHVSATWHARAGIDIAQKVFESKRRSVQHGTVAYYQRRSQQTANRSYL